MEMQEPLRLQKAFRSEGVTPQNATILLHKRPYMHYKDIQLNSSQRHNEQEDILTLETASFKRKIRKPLKFENTWKNSVNKTRELQTQKNVKHTLESKVKFFNLKTNQNLNLETGTMSNPFSMMGQRLDSTRSCALQATQNLFGEENYLSTSNKVIMKEKENVSSNSHKTGGIDARKSAVNNESCISDESCFKVPLTIPKQ